MAVNTRGSADYIAIFDSHRGAGSNLVTGDGSLYWFDLEIEAVYAAGGVGEDWFDIRYGNTLHVTSGNPSGTSEGFPANAFTIRNNDGSLDKTLPVETFVPNETRRFPLTGTLTADLGPSDSLALYFNRSNPQYLVDFLAWGEVSGGEYAVATSPGANGGRWTTTPAKAQDDPGKALTRDMRGDWITLSVEVIGGPGGPGMSADSLGNVNFLPIGRIPELPPFVLVLVVFVFLMFIRFGTLRRRRRRRYRK
jgi:hypothetical protein